MTDQWARWLWPGPGVYVLGDVQLPDGYEPPSASLTPPRVGCPGPATTEGDSE